MSNQQREYYTVERRRVSPAGVGLDDWEHKNTPCALALGHRGFAVGGG